VSRAASQAGGERRAAVNGKSFFCAADALRIFGESAQCLARKKGVVGKTFLEAAEAVIDFLLREIGLSAQQHQNMRAR
jgi:hypothetical protein